jgi:hypothetical protein
MIKRKRGRPTGTIVRLLDDPGRFEIAAWFAFTVGLGMDDYRAAYAVIFLITITAPITTETIEDVLLNSSTRYHDATVRGHADRVVRKAREAISRANEQEKAWLVYSSGLIAAVVQFTATGNAVGCSTTLDLLRGAGWTEALDCIGKRIEASMCSNFAAADSKLSRTAARLLRNASPQD